MERVMAMRSKGLAAVVLMAALVVPSALAATTAEQKQRLLQERKDWTEASYNRRLAILSTHRRCVGAAEDQAALKQCRKQAKQARRQLKQDRLARLNAVRRELGLKEKQPKPSRRARRRRQQRAQQSA